MRWDFFPFMDNFFNFKIWYFSNVAQGLIAVCCLIIFLKIKHSEVNGALRRHLMGYFGMSGLAALLMVLHHPFYNPWMPILSTIMRLIAIVELTYTILDEFWYSKSQAHLQERRKYGKISKE